MGRFGLAFCALLMTFSLVSAQNIPDAPNRLVSDYTGTLNQAEVTALENKLLAFEDSTSNQIAVVLVKTTDGYDVADYAVRLAKNGVSEGKIQQRYRFIGSHR